MFVFQELVPETMLTAAISTPGSGYLSSGEDGMFYDARVA